MSAIFDRIDVDTYKQHTHIIFGHVYNKGILQKVRTNKRKCKTPYRIQIKILFYEHFSSGSTG